MKGRYANNPSVEMELNDEKVLHQTRFNIFKLENTLQG